MNDLVKRLAIRENNMNKLLEEFAKKANIEFTYDPTEDPKRAFVNFFEEDPKEVHMRAFVECWKEELEFFAYLIIKKCVDTCDSNKYDYAKYRKNARDREEKEIYAEGEAACDAIKSSIMFSFGVK